MRNIQLIFLTKFNYECSTRCFEGGEGYFCFYCFLDIYFYIMSFRQIENVNFGSLFKNSKNFHLPEFQVERNYQTAL